MDREQVRIHKHMEEGLVFFTDGAGYDCPPERGCWFESEFDWRGWRQIRVRGEGAILVPPDDPRVRS